MEEEEEEGDRVAAVSWNLRRTVEDCAARLVHPHFWDRFSSASERTQCVLLAS